MSWYKSRPRFGSVVEVAHFFTRGARTPICVGTEAIDPGGTVSLLAAETSPKCEACRAALADACGRAMA